MMNKVNRPTVNPPRVDPPKGRPEWTLVNVLISTVDQDRNPTPYFLKAFKVGFYSVKLEV